MANKIEGVLFVLGCSICVGLFYLWWLVSPEHKSQNGSWKQLFNDPACWNLNCWLLEGKFLNKLLAPLLSLMSTLL